LTLLVVLLLLLPLLLQGGTLYLGLIFFSIVHLMFAR
jgi:hypothetical protein